MNLHTRIHRLELRTNGHRVRYAILDASGFYILAERRHVDAETFRRLYPDHVIVKRLHAASMEDL